MSFLRVAALVTATLGMSCTAHAADTNPLQIMAESGNQVLALAKLYNDAHGKVLTNGNPLDYGLTGCYQIDMLNLQVIASNMTLTTSLMALAKNSDTTIFRQQTLEALAQASVNLKVSAMSALATVKTQSANPLCKDSELQKINRHADDVLTGIVAAFDTLPDRPY